MEKAKYEFSGREAKNILEGVIDEYRRNNVPLIWVEKLGEIDDKHCDIFGVMSNKIKITIEIE